MLFLGAGAVLVGIVTIMYGLYDVLSMMYEENHRLIQVGVAFLAPRVCFGCLCRVLRTACISRGFVELAWVRWPKLRTMQV